MNYDEIEQSIKSTLETIVEDWNAGKRFDWTAEVTSRLCALSHKLKFEACSRRVGGKLVPHAKYGEWLYDICWFAENDICVTHLPLVGECEWGPDGSCDGDFQKLLQARADHRLWLFQVSTEGKAEEMIKGCKEVISNFRDSQEGDRYLFAALIRGNTPILKCELFIK